MKGSVDMQPNLYSQLLHVTLDMMARCALNCFPLTLTASHAQTQDGS